MPILGAQTQKGVIPKKVLVSIIATTGNSFPDSVINKKREPVVPVF